MTAALPAQAPATTVVPEPDWPYLAAHGLDRLADCLRFLAGEPWHTLRETLTVGRQGTETRFSLTRAS